MTKRIRAIGNSAGIIIDKPILELLKITADTELDLSTDGERLIITPIRTPAARKASLARAQRRVLRDLQQLPVAQRPALGRPPEPEQLNLTEEWLHPCPPLYMRVPCR